VLAGKFEGKFAGKMGGYIICSHILKLLDRYAAPQ